MSVFIKTKAFIKATWRNLFVAPEGGLSVPKTFLLVSSCAATYKFIVADTNDPWIWLVFLGVVGGHAIAVEAVKFFSKKP